MLKFLIKYLLITLVLIFLISLFPNITNTLRFTLVSIVKNIFPAERTEPVLNKINFEKPHETINANSFEIYVNELSSFAGYNSNSDESINNQHKSIETCINDFSEKKSVSKGKLIQPLRVSLCGSLTGPSMTELMILLGKETCIRRINNAQKILGK